MVEGWQDLPLKWWTKQIDDIDHEILRLAVICDAHLLQPGVVERILHNDASVCGKANALAFEKLRMALMMHYAVRQKSVAALGSVETAQIVTEIVARLAQKMGKTLPPGAGQPPAAH